MFKELGNILKSMIHCILNGLSSLFWHSPEDYKHEYSERFEEMKKKYNTSNNFDYTYTSTKRVEDGHDHSLFSADIPEENLHDFIKNILGKDMSPYSQNGVTWMTFTLDNNPLYPKEKPKLDIASSNEDVTPSKSTANLRIVKDE